MGSRREVPAYRPGKRTKRRSSSAIALLGGGALGALPLQRRVACALAQGSCPSRPARHPSESPPAPSSQEALAFLLHDVLPRHAPGSDREYLRLTDHTNRLIERADGTVQDLPKPTDLKRHLMPELLIR
jgi:hypothetical protein